MTILPPQIPVPDSPGLVYDPYIDQVILTFSPIPSGPPLLLSLASMFEKVQCLRCLGCDQELWQVVGGIMERGDLEDKMVSHVGTHIPAAFMTMEKIQ